MLKKIKENNWIVILLYYWNYLVRILQRIYALVTNSIFNKKKNDTSEIIDFSTKEYNIKNRYELNIKVNKIFVNNLIHYAEKNNIHINKEVMNIDLSKINICEKKVKIAPFNIKNGDIDIILKKGFEMNQLITANTIEFVDVLCSNCVNSFVDLLVNDTFKIFIKTVSAVKKNMVGTTCLFDLSNIRFFKEKITHIQLTYIGLASIITYYLIEENDLLSSLDGQMLVDSYNKNYEELFNYVEFVFAVLKDKSYTYTDIVVHILSSVFNYQYLISRSEWWALHQIEITTFGIKSLLMKKRIPDIDNNITNCNRISVLHSYTINPCDAVAFFNNDCKSIINIYGKHCPYFDEINNVNNNDGNVLSLELCSSLDYNICITKFEKFIKKINSNSNISENNKEKVKIYNIRMESSKKINEKTNPEYTNYMNLINKQNEILNNNNENSQAHNLVISLEKIPLEKIIEEELVYDFKIDLINSTFKDISTLYLRESCINHLINSLNNFKNNKIYDELCIPKKLGILLHGVPGTGKTTTVKAIASYMNRDIYYVNLNNIKTNNHLGEIFNKINNDFKKKGIVVFEDIDIMTDIVKARNYDDICSNITNLNHNDELSLSYFLNSLDGTLCEDELIFIITTNHKNILDPAIYRSGRIDVDIELKKCDHYQIKLIYSKIMKRTIDDNILNKIKEYEFTPAQVIFKLIDYMYKDDLKDGEILEEFISEEK